ncbi:unnamed protein product [Zymoseptoria tritici ST99CH_3D7]|uniref:Uncharacterized protein n=1 Tax=Zymoseptoria tritici (strain ST99CH_3D7) TaxID=1276538 RepID=A0A1X7SAF3_ZYMT9|nr:unnamed protein product [Zymoseptoria tritici ST99CH_3D7]
MAGLHVSLHRPSSRLDEVTRCAEDVNGGIAALDKFRKLWLETQTEDSRVKSPLTRALSASTTANLIRHFNQTYLENHNDRNYHAALANLLSGPWKDELPNVLCIYALFGACGITRSFLQGLRNLSKLQIRDDESLSLERAKELLDRAREQRLSKRGVIKKTSHTRDWRPADCTVARAWAIEEDHAQQRVVQSTRRNLRPITAQKERRSDGLDHRNGSENREKSDGGGGEDQQSGSNSQDIGGDDGLQDERSDSDNPEGGTTEDGQHAEQQDSATPSKSAPSPEQARGVRSNVFLDLQEDDHISLQYDDHVETPDTTACLSKRCAPGAFTTAQFWEQHRTESRMLKIARDVITTFRFASDELMMDGSIDLLERAAAMQHNAKTRFTTLVSFVCHVGTGTRLWFAAEVDLAGQEATSYTLAPPEADSAIRELIEHLHPGLKLSKNERRKLPTITDTTVGEEAGFLACLAVATSIIADRQPPPALSTLFWTAVVQVCQTPVAIRRTSKLYNDLPLFPYEHSGEDRKRPRLDSVLDSDLSIEQVSLRQTLQACRQKKIEMSRRISQIEAYADEVRHIQSCTDVTEVRPAPNLTHIKAWADMMAKICLDELTTVRNGRNVYLQGIRDILLESDS